MTRLTTLATPEAAAGRAAREMAQTIEAARRTHDSAHVALAGGNTPRRAYELLADLLDDWSAVELWYGDERCVPPDDPESNHRMVVDSLLAGIKARLGPEGGPLEHRIRGELRPEEAARAYARELCERVPIGDAGLPVLDLAVQGLGEDGHTASLFPGHPEVEDERSVCLPVRDAPKPPPERVTLGIGVLRAARSCLLLATGSGKAEPLAAVLAGPDIGVPASLLRSGRLHVIADDAAAPPPDSR